MNLHKIFQYLVDDNEFLTIVEQVTSNVERKTHIMDIITDVKKLDPGTIEPYDEMPKRLRRYLNETYARHGIMPVIERATRIVNVSFLVSLDILLRPGHDFERNVTELEAYLSHSIIANCQIDKVKNTSKVKAKNKEIQSAFLAGQMTDEVLNRIVNILEINLVIFDFDRGINKVYWSHGTKYQTVNPFRRLYIMTLIQGDYEPIKSTSEDYSVVYAKIMTPSFEFYPDLKLGSYTLPYINTWAISDTVWRKIIQYFYPPTYCDVEEYVDRVSCDLAKC